MTMQIVTIPEGTVLEVHSCCILSISNCEPVTTHPDFFSLVFKIRLTGLLDSFIPEKTTLTDT